MASAREAVPDTTGGDVVPVIIEQAVNRITVEVERTTRGPKWQVKVTVYDPDIAKAKQQALRLTHAAYAELEALYAEDPRS